MTTVLERPTELKQSKTALHVEDNPNVQVREIHGPVNCIILSGSDLRRECSERGIEFMYKGTFDGKSLVNYLSRIH